MTNKEKFRQEVREFYKTEESKAFDSWKTIDCIGAKYDLDEFDIDEGLFILEAEDLVLNKKCETLEEAFHYLAEADRRLTEAIRNNTTIKPNKWLLLEDISDEDEINLQELLKDLYVEKLTDGDINKRLKEDDELKFDKYVNDNNIPITEVNHFKAHVSSPWNDYSSNSSLSMATYKNKVVSRTLLPPFASTLIESFEGYNDYNTTFSQMKSLHSIDCDSREVDHLLSNIDKLVSDYTAIGYVSSRNSKYATKITNQTFKYTYKRAKKTSKNEVKLQTIEDSADLLCFIQYVYGGGEYISSSGVVADNSNNRTNLGCSSSSSLPKSEYASTQDLKFSCNYYICHINEKFNEDTKKIEYKFKYEEINNQPIKSIIDKYKSQDKNTKDIIYMILNNLTKTRMYDLGQGHTHELLEYYRKTYKDDKHTINLSFNHKPLNIQSVKDALKELDDIDN